MASTREPRRTAGNRMSKVLEEELDEDDFYKNTYGGFNDKEDDNDFDAGKEDSADEVDSDFDVSEKEDEIVSDQDEDTIKREEKKKKRAAVSSKAYKEPKKAKNDEEEDVRGSAQLLKKEKKVEKKTTDKQPSTSTTIQDGPSRKSSRRATAANSYLIGMKVKERQIADQKKKVAVKKSMVGVRRLTQEELMQEAERTERKNLKSLHHYQRLEASRKKISSKKRTISEPTIKYISTSMPDPEQGGKISRNFIVFSEEAVMKKEFHWKKLPRVSKLVCPVTNKQAKYIDPVTNTPYYDIEAFRSIRQDNEQIKKKVNSRK